MSQERLVIVLKAGLVGALLGIGGYIDIDAITGYEISVFPLYALPIALAVRFFEVKAGLGASALAALVWAWAHVSAGHVYSKPWIVYFNAGARLIFFVFVALAVAHAVKITKRARTRLQNFSGTLPVCLGCSRIRDSKGHWWDTKVFLHAYGGAEIQSRLCPECAHEAYAAEPPSPALIGR